MVTAKSSKRSPAKIVMTMVMVIVIAIAVLLAGAYSWVNGKLNKVDWLTGMANTEGTSWLVLGSDQRDDSGLGGSPEDVPGFRTDTILVLTKPKTGPSSLISIPRDSLVKNGQNYMKINSVAEQYGKKNLVSQVEHISGKKIDHVALIKFGGLKDVVDAIGGVNLCYDQTVSDPDSQLNWQAGCHTADGATALAFSRMRYSDPKGDFGRAERQRQVIGAIMTKSLSKETLTKPSRVQKLASTALAAVEVDKKTSPLTLISMVTAFKAATGKGGVSGSVYWTDPGYYVDGVGSSVLLDDARNHTLFNELAEGSHKPGTVGTLAEPVSQ